MCQNSSENINYQKEAEAAFKETQIAVKEFQSRKKDTKDSAWINDFRGNTVWDARTKSKEGKTITLIDSTTKNYYVLDSSHTVITAYDKLKKVIWKTNPTVANKLPEYIVKRPTITYFAFGKDNTKEKKEIIGIGYNNSQFGFLDKKIGKFTFEGQD